jgi:penicillin amidase
MTVLGARGKPSEEVRGMNSADFVALDVPGIKEQVEILVDEWGVPHIYAANEDDVFFAQGFNAARDRLFHMDLWRRRGLGRLAEVFGPEYVERDRAARLFLYRGDMRAEWLAYGSDTKRVATAFVAGINCYVALALEDDSYLPPEFKELGYRPSFWEPADIARIRSHGLYYNLEEEVARACTLRDFGPDVENLRRVREPAHDLKVPEGLDLSVIPDDVLTVYRLATTPPDLSTASRPPSRNYDPEGSNNWVIGPELSATGRPLLANDPHRVVSLPGLRYIAHLNAPGLDVIGAGEPGLPGISIGHNGKIAFGLTIFAIDQEDLYVYRTNPENSEEYWYRGRWTPMERLVETVDVAGEGPVEVELLFTRHGPVICQSTDRQAAFAVRAAWLEPGMAPYLGSLGYMRAPSAAAFVTAMNRWGAPGENQVYASPDGTIGWKPAGLVPVRPNWDGTLPVPGDGRYEWAGFYDGDELPAVQNPPAGWIATANQMNLPPDYPNADKTVSYDWSAPVRYERIAEVIPARSDWSVQDCVQLQSDYLSIPARRIVPLLSMLGEAPPDLGDAVALLLDWDFRLMPESAPAALFEVWYRRHLRVALLDAALMPLLPDEERGAALERVLPNEDMAADCRVDLGLLLEPGDRLGSDPDAAIRHILASSLRSAVKEVTARLGDDTQDWSWGALHQARLTHPQATALGANNAAWTTVGPVPRGGSGDTVGCTTYSADFIQTVGASFRLVVDVGAWDDSVAMNSPGQSGMPSSPHFDDLFEPWSENTAFPLLYSRERIEGHVREVILLKPSNGDSSVSG